MEQNQTYENVVCQDLTTDFIGTAMIEGKKVFIENFLPTETGNIRITEVKKRFIKGRVERLTKSSPMRRDSLVEQYPESVFGGCDLQTINYAAQMQIKKQLVEKIAKLQDRTFQYMFADIVASPETLYYRNKMHYQLYVDQAGTIKAGFYRKGTREMIEAKMNVLAQPEIAKMLEHVLQKLNLRGIRIASDRQEVHGLRAVMLRYSQICNQVMVIFIATTKYIKGVERIAKELHRENKIIKSVYLNVNGKNQGNILGQKSELLAGNVTIDDKLLGYEFLVTPQAFYQVNSAQTVKIYQQIKEWVSDSPEATVLDLYAGTGAIGLVIAKDVKTVKGVDIVDEAITIANINAKNNDVQNISFERADVNTFIEGYEADGSKLIAINDPPRSGCSASFITKLVDLEPKKIIYVSCNPKTLIRDLQLFRELGYTQKEIKLYDMSPETLHVESATLLTNTNVREGVVKNEYERKNIVL